MSIRHLTPSPFSDLPLALSQVGAGRTGKTALTKSLAGEPFKETESTIGLESNMTCTVKQMQTQGWSTITIPTTTDEQDSVRTGTERAPLTRSQ